MYSKNKKSKKTKKTKNPKKYFFLFVPKKDGTVCTFTKNGTDITIKKGGGKGEPLVPPIKLKFLYTINLKTQNKQLLNT